MPQSQPGLWFARLIRNLHAMSRADPAVHSRPVMSEFRMRAYEVSVAYSFNQRNLTVHDGLVIGAANEQIAGNIGEIVAGPIELFPCRLRL